jgi:hypothetical protein
VKIKYQADADLRQRIVSAVRRREPGIDFQTAHAAGIDGLEDLDVLKVAAREGRILVSHDKKTMPYYFGEFIQRDESPGLFIVSQDLAIGRAVEELIMIWAASETEEWINCISYIPL